MKWLFETFDSRTIILDLNWLIGLTILYFRFYTRFFIIPRRLQLFISNSNLILHNECKILINPFKNKNNESLIFTSLWLTLLNLNILGLFPYIFTITSHVAASFSFSIILYMGPILITLLFDINKIITHLVPFISPTPLIPLLVIIEFIRNIIRPLTLRIRLRANIITGHLILRLIASTISPKKFLSYLIILAIILILLLEIAVRVIQAQVFRILRCIYTNETIN